MTWPISIDPARRLTPPSPDMELYMWTLGWDAHAFVRQPFSIFDANIYYPERRTLAYSENLIGSALLAAPIVWTTGNLVLALNFVALSSCLLCAVGAYLLARRAGIGEPGSFISGVVFAFCPMRFLRLYQIHLATVQWIPFGLNFLIAYLDGARRRDLLLALGFLVLQALASGHGAVFMGVAYLVVLAYRFACGEPVTLARRARDFGFAGLAILALAAAVFVPYLRVQRSMGLRRALEDWAVNWPSFIASPTTFHAWMLKRLSLDHLTAAAQAFLFPGYLPIVLALLAIGWRRGSLSRRNVWLFALIGAAAAIFSIGPPLSVWPLVYWLPGLNLIRVPSRFTLLLALALAVLAGMGYEVIARGRRWPAAVLAVLMLAEFSLPWETTAYAIEIPAADRWLATRPRPFAIAEVPIPRPSDEGPSERRETRLMLYSTAHWQKTVHGYSGFRSAAQERLFYELAAFPDETSVASLERVGVTYVVVHTDSYPPERRADVIARIDSFGPRLKLQYVDPGARVYWVTRTAPTARNQQ